MFQAYATVASAAEGKDPDSEEYGKVDELKQYPLFYKWATWIFGLRFGYKLMRFGHSIWFNVIVYYGQILEF